MHYVSPIFPVQNVDTLQRFTLDTPQIGCYVRLDLFGRQQRQPGDELWYTVVRLLKVVGTPIGALSDKPVLSLSLLDYALRNSHFFKGHPLSVLYPQGRGGIPHEALEEYLRRVQGEAVDNLSLVVRRVEVKRELRELIDRGHFTAAANLAARAEKNLDMRDEETIRWFKDAYDERSPPISMYLQVLISNNIKMNAQEAVEFAKQAVEEQTLALLADALRTNMATSSEELGDFLVTKNLLNLAVIAYMNVHIPDKVIDTCVLAGMYRGILRYVQISGYQVDLADILQRFKKIHPANLTLEFALMLVLPDANHQYILDPHLVCDVMGVARCGQVQLIQILKDKLLLENVSEDEADE